MKSFTQASATRMPLDLGGERLTLLADKAVWWPAAETLFVADTHFGKSAAFRAAGLAAPDNTEEDLARLNRLLRDTNSDRLIVLGDFWHSPQGRSDKVLARLSDWRNAHRDLRWTVVLGNHDRGPELFPRSWRVEVVEHWDEPTPFLGTHQPCRHPHRYVLCGHAHPSLTLVDRQGASLRAPCFVVGRHRAVLPAFGSFTGTETWNPAKEDRLFAVGPDAIIEVPTRRR